MNQSSFRRWFLPIALLVCATSLLSCTSNNTPSIPWAQVEQGLSFAVEKVPQVISWLEERGYIDEADGVRAEIRALVYQVISNVAEHYIIELHRLPTWEELVAEVQKYIEHNLPEELQGLVQ